MAYPLTIASCINDSFQIMQLVSCIHQRTEIVAFKCCSIELIVIINPSMVITPSI